MGLWQLDRRQYAWWRTTGLIALSYALYGLVYRTDTAFVYLIPAWGMAALWLAEGIDRLARLIADRRIAWVLVVVLTVALPSAAVARFYPLNDASRDDRAGHLSDRHWRRRRTGRSSRPQRTGPHFTVVRGLWVRPASGHRAPERQPIRVRLVSCDARAAPSALFSGLPEDAPLEAVIQAAAARSLYAAEPLPVALPGLAQEDGEPLTRLRPAR